MAEGFRVSDHRPGPPVAQRGVAAAARHSIHPMTLQPRLSCQSCSHMCRLRAAAHCAAAVVIVSCMLLALSCTPPVGTPECRSTLRTALEPRIPGRKTLYESDLSLFVEGDEYRLRMSMVDMAAGTFYADIYSPFGTRVATIEGDRQAGEIVAGSRVYRVYADEPIGEIEGLATIPFTFADLKRILTGAAVNALVPDSKADAMRVDGRRGVMRWVRGDTVVTATVTGTRCRLANVQARAEDSSWVAAFSEFNEGGPREIRFGEGRDNYFVVRHKDIVVKDPISKEQ